MQIQNKRRDSTRTGTINAILYDEVVLELIGVSCKSVIEANPGIHKDKNPPPMQAMIEKPAKFRVIPTKNQTTWPIRYTAKVAMLIQQHAQQEPPALISDTPDTPSQQLTIASASPMTPEKDASNISKKGTSQEKQDTMSSTKRQLILSDEATHKMKGT